MIMQDSRQNNWYVKGPIGLGLDVDAFGHNVIFAAGTGVLVFLDLIAKLILQQCVEGGPKCFGPDFKITLYYTANSWDSAIGVELLNAF